jgi:hypothetical protein
MRNGHACRWRAGPGHCLDQQAAIATTTTNRKARRSQTMNTDKLLSKTPQEIARLYREAVFRQRRAPIATQWLFGAEIKRLKDAFYIASEERRLFR